MSCDTYRHTATPSTKPCLVDRRKISPVYGHPNLSHVERHKPDLRPVGHKGVVSANMCLQHVRFAITRLQSAKAEAVCSDGSNHLGAWSCELDSAIDLLERVIVGERRPDERIIPRHGSWVRRESD